MSTLPTVPATCTPTAHADARSLRPMAIPRRAPTRWRRVFRRLRQGGWRSGWVLTGTGLAVLGLMHLTQPDDSQADLARTLLGLGCVAVIRLLPGPRREP